LLKVSLGLVSDASPLVRRVQRPRTDLHSAE
jgi:hypothetical protein